MVVFIAHEYTAAVISKAACSPGADAGNADTAAVGFMLNIVLNAVLSPHLDFLLLRTFGFLAPKIQMLKYDAVCRIQYRERYDCIGNLFC